MKERGIIFNAEMARAVLDGRKTQTRRVMKAQPTPSKSKDGDYWFPCNKFQTMVHVSDFLPDIYIREFFSVCCPFGKIGDRLWVRETFALLGNEDGVCVDWNGNVKRIELFARDCVDGWDAFGDQAKNSIKLGDNYDQ